MDPFSPIIPFALIAFTSGGSLLGAVDFMQTGQLLLMRIHTHDGRDILVNIRVLASIEILDEAAFKDAVEKLTA